MKQMKKGLRDKVLARDGNACVRRFESPYTCRGRTNTIEHVQGRVKEELWNCITLCAYHHGVDEYQDAGGLDKAMNRYYAYKNIPDQELLAKKIGYLLIHEKRWSEKYFLQRFGDSGTI